MIRQLTEEPTPARACLYLIEKYCPRLMRQGGGGVAREIAPRTDEHKERQRAQCAATGHGRIDGRTKLSVEQVRIIRERRAHGEPLKALAYDFGVSMKWVSRITSNPNERKIA